MKVLPLCDEQQFILDSNEELNSIPMQISYSMRFTIPFSPEELYSAVEKCIMAADVFTARCIVKEGHGYMEFFSYEKEDIPIFHFSSEEEYQSFCMQASETKINNRDKLYYIFIFSISDSYYHLHFIFNHLILDGISGLALSDKIQEALLKPNEEISCYPFSVYLDSLKNYKESEKYLKDQAFWENRFLEISNSEYLFRDVIDTKAAQTNSLTFQTDPKLKELMAEYCKNNNISPHILIVTVLAQIINDKTGCKRFYFEIPIANRLGEKEKNSIGAYEITFPFVFDFATHHHILDLLEAVQKQSMDYYRHKNFDWNSKIRSWTNEGKGKRYIPQFCFSYFCRNIKPAGSLAILCHYPNKTDILPMNLYVSDYLDWQTVSFCYTYWADYFTDEEVTEIHHDIEDRITNIITSNE